MRGGLKSRGLFAVSLTVLLASGFVAPTVAGAAKPATETGTLEICKSAKHGMTGRQFQFSVNGGSPITVAGGACSGPMIVGSGNTTVTEAATADTEVAKIKANHVVNKDTGARTVTVKVVVGSTPQNETAVTFVNRPIPALGLKICKQTPDATLYNDGFSFTENGGPAFSVPAGPIGAPKCGPITKFPLGTNVNIAELPVANTFVSSITVSDNRGSNVNTTAGTVTATVGTGVTIVTYTNNVAPVGQYGFIEVCKYGADEYVAGNFDFTITAGGGFTSSQSVTVGQCTPPIRVPAGNVSVAEAARFPWVTSVIAVAPAGRLVTSNLANQTATVTVPVGDESTETIVNVTNTTQTGQLKICKTLAPNATALAGKPFMFYVNPVLGTASSDTIIAGPAGSTTCVFHHEALPLGSPATIVEVGQDNVQNSAISVVPANRGVLLLPPAANVTIGTGVTTVKFTNTALGTIEICKTAADSSTATQTFQFSVNGSAPISVSANHCSPPITVPAGTATVSEVASTNFHLVGIVAVGPGAVNRLTTSPTANPATVLVPFGGVDNETVVTFTNAVNTGQFKICKASPDPTLQNVTFHFAYKYFADGPQGLGTLGSADLKPGQCSSFSGLIPVVGADGLPIPVIVAESVQPTVQVSNVTVSNGTLVSTNLPSGVATINVNATSTVVTFTNVRTPLGTLQICKKSADPSTATQTFQFSVNGGAPISVAAGGCSADLAVLSGTATVEEVAKANFHLTGVTATGPGNVNRLTSGPTDNPATVTIVPGNASTKTVATFTNAVDVGELDFCKTTTAESLLHTEFAISGSFVVNGSNFNPTAHLEPGECAIVAFGIPVVDPAGNPIPIALSETLGATFAVGDIAIDNGTLSNVNLPAGTATGYVKAGVTTVTYSNSLPARVKVCKEAADASAATPDFDFEVTDSTITTIFSLKAGECVDIPVHTTTGTVTVEESAAANFHVASITATGPSSDDRLVTGPTDNPATVSVYAGGTGNMTTVTVTNAVDTGTFRVCKLGSEPSLQDTEFLIIVTAEIGNSLYTFPVALHPGSCSNESDPIPLVDPSGNPYALNVAEGQGAGFHVFSIGTDNYAEIDASNLGDGTATLHLTKTGVTTITYINEADGVGCRSAATRVARTIRRFNSTGVEADHRTPAAGGC